MEASNEPQSQDVPEPKPADAPVDAITAKQMAAAEEANALRMKQIVEQQQKAAEPKPEEPTLIGLAAQGMDVLHDAIRRHSNQPSHPDYTPPPRTERQMTALQEELEAGRRAQKRAQEQAQIAAEARAKSAKAEVAKEGFTTPVYRPDGVVPDPTIPSATGSVAGTRAFGRDAP